MTKVNRSWTIGFESLLLVLVGVGLLYARNWPAETALLPLSIGSSVFVLLLVMIFRDLKIAYADKSSPFSKGYESLREAISDNGLLPTKEMAYLVGFVLGIGLLGFYPSVFLYLLVSFRLKARMSLMLSFGVAILIAAILFLFFCVLVDSPPYLGALYEWLV